MIPSIIIDGESAVKGFRYSKYQYIGDPLNIIKIYSDFGPDEIVIFDITSNAAQTPNYDFLKRLARESTCPLSYGGGITDPSMASKVISLGYEKIIINIRANYAINLVREISRTNGKQSVVAKVDFRKKIFSKSKRIDACSEFKNMSFMSIMSLLEESGAGEVIVSDVYSDGTRRGFDYSLVESLTNSVSIPILYSGGFTRQDHLGALLEKIDVSGVVVGAEFIFYKKSNSVMPSYINGLSVADLRYLEK
ncbi:HisA/HisF-related TIM barrel protein [Alphaproteobacteria bacterium]|nr:HisA/HisF-related TIM barrel protein [Alphaproteobacteria bacterium]